MENASKALIIAGAILISILLISVGILVFNSTRGVTDNAGETGDAMMLAAAAENSKIVLATIDIKNDDVFNNYIKSKYEKATLSKQEVINLCELIKERTFKVNGNEAHSHEKIHITCDSSISVAWQSTDGTMHYSKLKDDKQYGIEIGTLSIRVVEK